MKKTILTIFEGIFIFAAIYSLSEVDYQKYFFTYLILALIMHYIKKHIVKDNKPYPTPPLESDYIQNDILESNEFKTNNSNVHYSIKAFLTPYEFEFYKIIKQLEQQGFIIVPQINLASIINKENSKYRSELFRNIDFGIFDNNFNLKLLIELNDKSHQNYERRDRDLKVKKILNDCNIKLINFYTYYPNEKEYVLKRIYNELETTIKTQNN